MFEEKIVEVSKEKIAKLYEAAKIAEETPGNGVEILNKSAKYIIRDCAKLTKAYLPLFLYGMLKNPLESLKKQFSKNEIADFVIRTQTSTSAKQLLTLILDDIRTNNLEMQKLDKNIKTDKKVVESASDLVDEDYDPYSEYSMEATKEPEPVAEVPKALEKLVEQEMTQQVIIDLLCETFAPLAKK